MGRYGNHTLVWLLPYLSFHNRFNQLNAIGDLLDSGCACVGGTVKFFGILSYGTTSVETNPWTFGQLVAVILLATPVFTMIWKFAEYTPDPDGAPNDSQTAPQHCNTGDAQKFAEENQNWRHLFTDIESLSGHNSRDIETNTNNANGLSNSTTAFLDRNYYTTASWLWPGVAPAYLSILALIVLMFLYTNLSFRGTPVLTMGEFWISELFMFTLPIFGFPCACSATFVCGLRLDHWFRRPSGWKSFLLFLFGSAMQAVYILDIFGLGPGSLLIYTNGFLPNLVTSCLLFCCYVFAAAA